MPLLYVVTVYYCDEAPSSVVCAFLQLFEALQYSIDVFVCYCTIIFEWLLKPLTDLFVFQRSCKVRVSHVSWQERERPLGSRSTPPTLPFPMYPESTTDSPARLSLRQTGSPGMVYRSVCFLKQLIKAKKSITSVFRVSGVQFMMIRVGYIHVFLIFLSFFGGVVTQSCQ